MNTSTTDVTVLGLGNLGQALAGTLLRAGHIVTVWNRSAGRDRVLVERGARPASTVAQAVAASPLVVVSVLDQPAVRQVLGQAGPLLSGRSLVNLTSGSPRAARELAAWAGEQGAWYLAGAVYAVPQTVGTPEATIHYSAEAGVRQRWEGLLEALGRGGRTRGWRPPTTWRSWPGCTGCWTVSSTRRPWPRPASPRAS
ncbi:NAD binding domain of 6-phosphogluconate dehydrogenase [Streptoalloteichus tenebrarius]|uniref:NAD binding domain of 6-phosphogluconate dehydrogenase n=1 Tax=Streptoalloteichus tenebrarius (strain ATCC 17920 / DSM 40477 / JCM 4838 / CBS 697.72 / NBRC 16177 / NCIMB 11028 / NRRL B-12390 / A12253. 1 / ISP 5477) TaxID=1933 RepID=A0ABT1I443_STRSD|nr:NAD(P)-binding domain-containing protein [Streptoalloteichus tenebrarius]MCP2262510.1 NAD binding domain of 6-phosphogluconate dehydrogenase [Streptoalloteichus tenebrarius]BFE99107.1 hypothetical protein GCM10020241_07830 [Streptoalloteichus tenebrarius]